MMALQRGRREPVLGEQPLDAAIVDRLVIALPDDPRQFACGERMGHGQPYKVLLDLLGEPRLDGRPAAAMRQSVPIDQAEEPSLPEAPQITPQSPIAQPRDAALLGE